MTTRRRFLQSVPAAIGVAALPGSPTAKEDDCHAAAGALVSALTSRHGGEWAFAINHELKTAVFFSKTVSQPSVSSQ